MTHGLRFRLAEKLYIKDPQDTSYGKRLLEHGVILMSEIGFESFTFKKLALRMDSSETSIYRYFENKHLFLLYLNCWYWEWVRYLIQINTINIEDPKKKLAKAIHNLINASKQSTLTIYINESLLHKIIVVEGTKSYHGHSVNVDNQDGMFSSYKELVAALSVIVLEVNPKFKYPKSLCSTLFEMVNNQIFYAEYIPKLTDIKDNDEKWKELESMVSSFALAAIHA